MVCSRLIRGAGVATKNGLSANPDFFVIGALGLPVRVIDKRLHRCFVGHNQTHAYDWSVLPQVKRSWESLFQTQYLQSVSVAGLPHRGKRWCFQRKYKVPLKYHVEDL